MGKTTVEVRLENALDWLRAQGDGNTEPRRVDFTAHVGTGAAELFIPKELASKLELREVRHVDLELADGRAISAPVIGPVQVTVLGRTIMHEAVVLPEGTEPLLGVILLERMDFIVDPKHRKIIPRDERGPRLSAKSLRTIEHQDDAA